MVEAVCSFIGDVTEQTWLIAVAAVVVGAVIYSVVERR